MKLFLFFIFTISLFANDYFAKIEPINTYTVQSKVSGSIVQIKQNLENHFIKHSVIIEIDKKEDLKDKIQLEQKLNNFKEILQIEKETLKSFQKVSAKSKLDKDTQKIKILNTQSTINDLTTQYNKLLDKINDKTVTINNLYLDNIAVSKGDWVNIGTLLYTAYDLSKGKITIYIPIDDIKNIISKTIYLNDKKTNLKLTKISKVADKIHISAYKCEIVIPQVKQFSQIVKINFK